MALGIAAPAVENEADISLDDISHALVIHATVQHDNHLLLGRVGYTYP